MQGGPEVLTRVQGRKEFTRTAEIRWGRRGRILVDVLNDHTESDQEDGFLHRLTVLSVVSGS